MIGDNYIHDVYDKYSVNALNNAQNEHELVVWSVWGKGALFLYQRLSELKIFNIPINSMDQARNVLNLLTQPLISFLNTKLEKQEPISSDEMIETHTTDFQNIQTLFSMQSPNVLAIHLILDTEFIYYLDDFRKTPAYYIGMFHLRYLECLSEERIVEWGKHKVPIESWKNFLNHCDELKVQYLDMDMILKVFRIISDVNAQMLQEINHSLK